MHGKGICNESLEKVFLPYYSTKPLNAGIGLSLAQQILLLHDARFEVETTPGNGAVFTIVF